MHPSIQTHEVTLDNKNMKTRETFQLIAAAAAAATFLFSLSLFIGGNYSREVGKLQ